MLWWAYWHTCGCFAYMLDEFDAAKVEVVLCICFQHCLVVYAVGSNACVAIQL